MQLEHLEDATGGIMTPEHRAQMRRLATFRESARMAGERAALAATTPQLIMRTSLRAAQAAGENNGDCDGGGDDEEEKGRRNQLGDPLIFPGVYAPSGIDMMSILVRVRLRPSPKIDLGFIDDRCALLLCDLHAPDTPIIYCSEPFSLLTGYSASEVIGKNCRFLQSPDGNVLKGVRREHTDDTTVYELKAKISAKEEATTILNYKKGGESFENILTTIPIRWNSESEEVRYVVGFQVDKRKCLLGPASNE